MITFLGALLLLRDHWMSFSRIRLIRFDRFLYDLFFLFSEHLAEFSIPSSFYYARVFWIVFNNNLLETRKSLWQRAKARNTSFKTLYDGQFTLSTQLIALNYPVIISHRRSSTVSRENFCPYSKYILSKMEKQPNGKDEPIISQCVWGLRGFVTIANDNL